VLVLFALVSCAPPNDNCTGAQSISLPATPACPNGDGATVAVTGTTAYATDGILYPPLTGCSVGGSQQSNAQDVWYSFVATGTILNLSINSSFATPNIGLWTGTCSSLQGIDCALGNTAGVLNYINTSIIPGQTYFIQVSTNTSTVSGSFTLTIDNDLNCNNCFTTAPTATSPQTFCSNINPTVANLTATGASLQWYNASTGGSPLPGTTALVSGTYFVSQTVGGCESGRTPVTVTITTTALPTASSPQAFCSNINPTITNLTATGSNLQWYNASTGGSPLPGTTALVPGTYYVSQTVGGCESGRAPVTVTITATALPTATSPANILQQYESNDC
jgi:hypothetical protein